MRVIDVLGRVPILRDKLQLPAIGKDGRHTYITPRQALAIEKGIRSANRSSRIDPGAINNQPNLLDSIVSFLSKIFSTSS